MTSNTLPEYNQYIGIGSVYPNINEQQRIQIKNAFILYNFNVNELIISNYTT